MAFGCRAELTMQRYLATRRLRHIAIRPEGETMREELGLFIDTKNGDWIGLGLPNSEPGENAMMVLHDAHEAAKSAA